MAERKGAAVRHARGCIAVRRCVVVSPYRALLRQRLAPVGSFVGVGDPIARLVDVNDIELVAHVRGNDIEAIEHAPSLNFVAGTRCYRVTTRSAVAVIDSDTRNRELRLDFAAERPLRGSAGQLVWRDPRPHVPGLVLVERDATFGLFVVANGHAQFVPLPAAQPGRATPVTLAADSQIVTEGHYGLRDGQAVA